VDFIDVVLSGARERPVADEKEGPGEIAPGTVRAFAEHVVADDR
jgi:hypothetical protein